MRGVARTRGDLAGLDDDGAASVGAVVVVGCEKVAGLALGFGLLHLAGGRADLDGKGIAPTLVGVRRFDVECGVDAAARAKPTELDTVPPVGAGPCTPTAPPGEVVVVVVVVVAAAAALPQRPPTTPEPPPPPRFRNLSECIERPGFSSTYPPKLSS